MKVAIQCGRCEAKFDVEEGLKIATCYSPINRRYIGHTLEVDVKSEAGKKIVQHIERKPVVIRK